MRRDPRLLLVLAGGAGLAVVAAVLLLVGAGRVGLSGTGGFVPGGLTTNSLNCQVPVQGTTYPTGCILTFTVNSGAQSVNIGVNGANLGQWTSQPLTMTGSLTLTAAQPTNRLAYQIFQQANAPVLDIQPFFAGHNAGNGIVDIYNPGQTSKNPATASASGGYTCKMLLGRDFAWDVESIIYNYGFGTWFLYLCSEAKQLGTFGTLSGLPEMGQEVALTIGTQTVKIGNGRVGSAPSVAPIPGLGASTCTWDGALSSGARIPSGGDFAAVWFYSRSTWQIIPNSYYVNYPGTATRQTFDTTVKSSYSDFTGPSKFYADAIKQEFLTSGVSALLGSTVLAPIWAGSRPDDPRIFAAITSLDSTLINLRNTNAALAAINTNPADFPVSLQDSKLSDQNQPSVVVVNSDSWGNAQITCNFDGTAVQSLGITIATAKPTVIPGFSGQASVTAGGALNVQVRNDGSNAGAIQVTATCSGVVVSPATVTIQPGQTITVPLAVNAGTLASAQTLQCTATATDMGSGASSTASGSLGVTASEQCINGQIQINGQTALQCQGGKWVTYLPCPAGTAIGGSGSALSCVTISAGGALAPVPSPVVGGVAPPAGVTPGRVTFAPSGLNWTLIILAVAVIAGVVTVAALALRRRGPPPMEAM